MPALPLAQTDPTLVELEALTAETFQLWDERRVGFSWRHYYMNHTLRVRANALAIGKEEGADSTSLAYAATLHDITKRYDGQYQTDKEGRRVVNDDGFWINDPLMPARENAVTKLYHELNLYSRVHHDSGATIASRLLADRGFNGTFCDRVAHIIRGHLRSPNSPWTPGGSDDPYGDPESCSLFDADTIDANLGAVAFYRHVHIHGHRAITREDGLDLNEYVDAIAEWVERKVEFVENRLTETGKEVARQRHDVDRRIAAWLADERRTPELMAVNREYGLMGLITFILKHHEDPNMRAELAEVKHARLPERRRRVAAGVAPVGADEAVDRVEQLLVMLDGEINGVI